MKNKVAKQCKIMLCVVNIVHQHNKNSIVSEYSKIVQYNNDF